MVGKKPLKLTTIAPAKLLVLMLAAAAMTLLQGCGRSYGTVGNGLGAPGANSTLVAIQITPSTSLILLAGTRQLFATGIYNDGTTQDISAQVTWSASSTPNTSNYVTVNSTGMASGMAIGASVITATMGPVVGVLQLTVNTNGFSSGTTAILPVPYKNTEVDAAYVPEPQTQIQGAYAVQEVNLDADQFSSVLPVQVALLASIPMPAGFVPNATAASQTSLQVAVISYSSPNVQIIDASNDLVDDPLSNTVVSTFTAPVTKSVTFNGIACIICAAIVNPSNNQLLLSTAQGYYSMDLTAGTFTPLPFTPAAFPAPNFALNPVASQPYIVSPTYGQDPAFPGEVQTLNLATNAVTSNTSSGLPSPNAAAIDLGTNFVAVTGSTTSDLLLADFTDAQSPNYSLVPNLSACTGQPGYFNMVALGVSANSVATNTNHTLFSSQTGGSCVGFQVWPIPGSPLDSTQIPYGYGSMPATPDAKPFVNGKDPNAITTFTSVIDKKNYGVLMNADVSWMAKINFATVFSNANIALNNNNTPIPVGQAIPPADLGATLGTDPIRYLPTPSTAATLSVTSINFGNPNVGTSTPAVPVTLTYIGTNPIGVLNISSIVIQGPNAGDFSETDTCTGVLSSQSKCTINITFFPSAKGARSATLLVNDDGGASPQTVALAGTGT